MLNLNDSQISDTSDYDQKQLGAESKFYKTYFKN